MRPDPLSPRMNSEIGMTETTSMTRQYDPQVALRMRALLRRHMRARRGGVLASPFGRLAQTVLRPVRALAYRLGTPVRFPLIDYTPSGPDLFCGLGLGLGGGGGGSPGGRDFDQT